MEVWFSVWVSAIRRSVEVVENTAPLPGENGQVLIYPSATSAYSTARVANWQFPAMSNRNSWTSLASSFDTLPTWARSSFAGPYCPPGRRAAGPPFALASEVRGLSVGDALLADLGKDHRFAGMRAGKVLECFRRWWSGSVSAHQLREKRSAWFFSGEPAFQARLRNRGSRNPV